MQVEITDALAWDIPVQYLKKDGSEGAIDLAANPPGVTSSDPASASASLSADGKTLTVVPAELAADTQVDLNGHCDVDPGDPDKELNWTLTVLIKSTAAGQVSTVNFGNPVGRPKP